MEIHPDFDAGEVARTVALAVTNLHSRTQSSDSGTDDTPLIKNRGTMNINTEYQNDDKINLVPPTPTSTTWPRCCQHIPARYVLTILGFLGFANVYALRVNLSVAMVAMVNPAFHKNTSSYECGGFINNSHKHSGDDVFNWSPNTQSWILGAFFYGYLVTQIPGGRMAEVFGAKWLYGVGVLSTSILTLLTPMAARWGVGALIVLRILEGLGEGVTFPAMHSMLGAWLPKLERSLLCTIVYSGAQIGTVISMPISGILCDSDFLGGWPSVFYVFGFLGCLWFVFWAWLIYEKPEDHPHMDIEELQLIQTGRVDDKQRSQAAPIPWKDIFTSVPVYTLMITHFGQNWGFYTFLTELPTYLSSILHFNIITGGYLSALPYLLQAIVSWIASYMADVARKRKYFAISTIRKIANTIGFFGPAACLFGVILAGCDYVWSIIFLTLAMGLNGCTFAGYMVTHVDMSPDFAGTLMGMTNAFATLAGFLAPKAVGALTEDNQTFSQWRIVFYIAITVYLSTGLLFIFCGSAKPQKWGISQEEAKNLVKSSDDDRD